MLRFMLAAAAIAIPIGSVAAQPELVRERAELMFDQGSYIYVNLNKMARGDIPYDQAKVDEAFAKLRESARRLPALYPETAKGQAPDADYFATSKVWENKADFDARFAKLAKDIEANAPKATNLQGLKEAREAIVQTCNGCHEIYRAKKN